MEEILASIRRIISEDDQPQAAAAEAAPEPAHEPEPEPDVFAAEEDVLELTQDMQEPEPVETVGDLDVYTPAPARAEPAYEPEPAPSYEPEPEPYSPPPAAPTPRADESLVGAAAASAAASAFGALSAAISMPRDSRTLEDVTRELLKPLLKQWLDENLPRVVEAAVKEEVERIARGRVA